MLWLPLCYEYLWLCVNHKQKAVAFPQNPACINMEAWIKAVNIALNIGSKGLGLCSSLREETVLVFVSVRSGV